MATLNGRHWTLTVDQDRIDVTSGLPTANERWTYTDQQGHEHRYDHGYPTLTYVIDESHWCDGSEGIYNHDPHEAVDKSHYECSICRETIKPLTDPPYTPKSVAGLTTATMTGYRSDGTWIRYVLSGLEVERIRAEMTDEEAQAILDNADSARIIESRWHG